MVYNSAIAQALADVAAADLLDLDALQVKCIAKLTAGGGEVAFTINGSQNGKSAAQECRRDALELLTLVNQAKSMPASGDGESVGVTYADFSDFNVPR
ncbi:MAG: hypothetical protein P4L99_28030 [Chthoniobacter sp.]|nr:hypothetical protein [Chthoniobacter sp.]